LSTKLINRKFFIMRHLQNLLLPVVIRIVLRFTSGTSSRSMRLLPRCEVQECLQSSMMSISQSCLIHIKWCHRISHRIMGQLLFNILSSGERNDPRQTMSDAMMMIAEWVSIFKCSLLRRMKRGNNHQNYCYPPTVTPHRIDEHLRTLLQTHCQRFTNLIITTDFHPRPSFIPHKALA
jgi:hypothetical protein